MSRTRVAIQQTDPTIAFFYKPHNVSLLLLFITALAYQALYGDQTDPKINSAMGISVSVWVILLTGLIQFRDGPFSRPHPAVWRVVLALGVAYQMFLCFMLYQTKNDARQLLKYFDASLGTALPEKNYAVDCAVTWRTIEGQMDVFVLAHTVGWIAKALVIRDYWLCWTLSILFELLEYSLEHQLPNFAECWWDHWILDVLLTNWLGIVIGMTICERLQVNRFSWATGGASKTAKVKTNSKTTQTSDLFHIITPQWSQFDWNVTKSFTNFFVVLVLIYLELQCELNAFYLKYLLWVPVSHPLNAYRLLFFFLMCLPAVKELYIFLSDPHCKRLGMHAWMTAANILTELLIVIKFSRDEFKRPAPTHIVVLWTIAIASLLLFAICKFWIFAAKSKQD